MVLSYGRLSKWHDLTLPTGRFRYFQVLPPRRYCQGSRFGRGSGLATQGMAHAIRCVETTYATRRASVRAVSHARWVPVLAGSLLRSFCDAIEYVSCLLPLDHRARNTSPHLVDLGTRSRMTGVSAAAHRMGVRCDHFPLKLRKVEIMKMLTIVRHRSSVAIAVTCATALVLCGCPSNEKKTESTPTKQAGPPVPAKPTSEPQAEPKTEQRTKPAGKPVVTTEPPEEKLTEEVEDIAAKPRDLGPPLVDHPANLKRLDPAQPVWVDRPDKQVVLQGEVCKAGYPLEFFATYSNRSYEAVVAVNVKPSIVHTGLLAVGATAGHPARFQPKFEPPEGSEVAIDLRWKDARGKVQSARAQDWIRDIKTKKALDKNWVFGGSEFVTDEKTKKQFYQADSGELICVLSLPNAMLDLPTEGYGAIEARSFEAFEEHLPPPGTPVTLLLRPILTSKSSMAKPAEKKPDAATEAKRTAAENMAVEAAEPWLALVDQGEYSQSWAAAADTLKNAVDRREFIKSLGSVRKPLGKVVSRQLESKLYTTSLPDAPAGQYVVLQYKTSFEHRNSATETVTPMLDKDKKWRVSGYYIR